MRPIGRPAEPGYGWPCCSQRHCMSPWPPFSGGRSDPIRPNPRRGRWCSNSCALGPTRQRPTSRRTTTDRHPQKRRQCRLRLRTMTPCPYHQRPCRLPPAPRSIPWPSPPERPNPCRRHRNAPRALSGPTRRPSRQIPPGQRAPIHPGERTEEPTPPPAVDQTLGGHRIGHGGSERQEQRESRKPGPHADHTAGRVRRRPARRRARVFDGPATRHRPPSALSGRRPASWADWRDDTRLRHRGRWTHRPDPARAELRSRVARSGGTPGAHTARPLRPHPQIDWPESLVAAHSDPLRPQMRRVPSCKPACLT